MIKLMDLLLEDWRETAEKFNDLINKGSITPDDIASGIWGQSKSTSEALGKLNRLKSGGLENNIFQAVSKALHRR